MARKSPGLRKALAQRDADRGALPGHLSAYFPGIPMAWQVLNAIPSHLGRSTGCAEYGRTGSSDIPVLQDTQREVTAGRVQVGGSPGLPLAFPKAEER